MKFGKHLITILSIFYFSTIEMALAFGSTIVLDFLFLRQMRKDANDSSTFILLVLAGFYMGILMTIVYYGRTFLRMIPFPLDGMFGFKHASMEEWVHLEAFFFFAIFYWDGLTFLVEELKERIITHTL